MRKWRHRDIHDLRREFPEAKIIAMSGRDRWRFDVFESRAGRAAKTFSKPFKFETDRRGARADGAKKTRA